jgi:predicted transglutaminase-like protease
VFEISLKGAVPDLEDINNESVKRLAERLKGRSDKETLTNILEWQEKNILYWADRWYTYWSIFSIVLIILFIALIALTPFVIFSALFLIALIGENSTLFWGFISFAIIVLTVSTAVTALHNLKISLVILSIYYLPVTVLELALVAQNRIELTSPIPIFAGEFSLSSFLIFLILLAFLKLKYRSIRSSNPKFSLWDTFEPSLPVGKILGYRLAICRDYAKLTAALLLNLYPSSEIYLITIPQHVAAGIKFNCKVYVLDQKLPVASLEKWLSFWREKKKKKKLKANVYKLIRNKELKAEEVDYVIIDKDFIPEVNLERLTNAIVAEIGVKQVSERSRPDLEISLKNFAICYEPDEIVEFSLIRAIKNKIESEFCGNLDKVSKIEILQDKNDLILRLYKSL